MNLDVLIVMVVLTITTVSVNAKTEDDCFEENTWYMGVDLFSGVESILSPADCQNRCKNNNNCKIWTWQKVSKSCYMGKDISSKVKDMNSISGPKDCDPTTTCPKCPQCPKGPTAAPTPAGECWEGKGVCKSDVSECTREYATGEIASSLGCQLNQVCCRKPAPMRPKPACIPSSPPEKKCDMSQRIVSDCEWIIGNKAVPITQDTIIRNVWSTCSPAQYMMTESCVTLNSGVTLTIECSHLEGGNFARFIKMKKTSHLIMTRVFAIRFGMMGFGPRGGFNGGVVRAADGGNTVKLQDVTFRDNKVTGSGGCVYLESGSLTIDNSYFIKNQAGARARGGAVFLSRSTATITKTSFVSNGGVTVNGGGIYSLDSDVSIIASMFTSNSAPLGGAIYTYNTGHLSLTNTCVFKYNKASDGGKDIYCAGDTQDAIQITISQNTIIPTKNIENYGNYCKITKQ